MTRINVHSEDGELGWFNTDTSERFEEDTWWNEQKGVPISVPTGSQWDHQALYRTPKGRWVLERSSQWAGVNTQYEFIDDENARRWLIQNQQDTAVERYFGEVEDESGPPVTAGRAADTTVEIVLSDATVAVLDARAAEEGVDRSEMIRRLVANDPGDDRD